MGTFFMSRQRLLRDTSPSLCSLREWDRPQSKAGLFANDARNTPGASFRQHVRCEHMWLPCIIIGRLQENTWEPVAYVQYAHCASTQDCGQLHTYNGLAPDAPPCCMNAHDCIQMRWRPLTRLTGVRSELLFGLDMQGLWQRGLAHLKAQSLMRLLPWSGAEAELTQAFPALRSNQRGGVPVWRIQRNLHWLLALRSTVLASLEALLVNLRRLE